jgi:DNA-binding protein HU-beta
MNKAQLIEKIATKTQSTKADTSRWLDAWIETVSHEMKNGEVRLAGFGTFTNAKRAARNGVNPQTGAKLRIPARKVPKFRPAAELKKHVK